MEANQTQTQNPVTKYTQMAVSILERGGQKPYVHGAAVVWRDEDECDRTLTFEITNDEGDEMPTIKINRDMDAVQVPPEGAALLGRSGWAWVRPEGEWLTATIVDVPLRRSILRDSSNDFEAAIRWVMGETDRKPRGLVTSESGGR